MRKLMIVIGVVLAYGILTGCGNDAEAAPSGYLPGQTVEAYNYVHGGYVGQAVVASQADGSLRATLDEAFLPHTLAIVDIEDDQWSQENTAYYVQRGNEVRVARHIAYNGTNYTGVTVGTSLSYVASDDQGEPVGGVDLEMMIIRSEANMAAWYANIAEGRFEIFTEFGGSPMPVTTTSYGSLFKRGSTYWNFGLGWQGNMDEVEAAAEEFGVGYSLDEMSRGDDDLWSLADAVTGATLTDFPDYFALIQTASARLKTH